jgi:hypothetical protein
MNERQGDIDAVLIQCPSTNALVDTGRRWPVVDWGMDHIQLIDDVLGDCPACGATHRWGVTDAVFVAPDDPRIQLTNRP